MGPMRNPDYDPSALAETIDQEIANLQFAIAHLVRVRDGLVTRDGYEEDHAAEHLGWAADTAEQSARRARGLRRYTAYPPTEPAPVIMDLGESA